MAVTAKQLANLRPIKKGQILNPEGGRAVNPVRKALHNLSIKEFQDIIKMALTSDLKSLKDFISDPKATAIQVGVARALWKAVDKGDWTIIEQIVSRIVGKIPDKLEVVSDNRLAITVIDQAKVIEANKKLENDY